MRSVVTRVISRAPGLRRLPFLKVLAVAEVALLARDHLTRLDRDERRRLVELVRRGRHLTQEERKELTALVAKVEPRLFAGLVADKLSPVPLPKRVIQGPPARSKRH